MGQEPNIRLTVEDLPRATARPPAPRRWVPQRPGDLESPESVPRGSAFGRPAPDIGYAYRIVRSLDIPGSDRRREDVEAALVAVMAARASAVGRAPTRADAVAAIELLGLDASGVDRLTGIAHDRVRLAALVDSVLDAA